MYSSKNLAVLMQKVAESGKCILKHYKGFDSIQAKESVWPNKLFNLQLSENSIDQLLNNAEKLAKQGKIAPTLVCPADEVDEHLLSRIRKRGYGEGNWKAMTLVASNLRLSSEHPDIEIVEFTDFRELNKWHAIVEKELIKVSPLDIEILQHLLNDTGCYFFSGKSVGETVTAAMLLVHEKEAGIYLVATQAINQGKGFGSAITAKCVEKAVDLGVRKVHLQATRDGASIYKKLGFQDCGNIELFKLTERKGG